MMLSLCSSVDQERCAKCEKGIYIQSSYFRRSVVDQRDLLCQVDRCCWCLSYALELVSSSAFLLTHCYNIFFLGLSEEARADFRLMKDVAVYTRQKPQDRTMGMKKFLDQMNA